MAGDDIYASPFGAAYSAYMERPRLARRVARVVWGGDTRPYYESMGAIGEVGEGGTIVDCPCGAGPALRALAPGRQVRYVGADLSPAMLERARRRAAERGVGPIELVEADAVDLPLETGCADLFLSYWGLHCFPDPAAALVEAERVLRPGGRLVGATFLRGRESLRQRLLIRPGLGAFGAVGTEAEVLSWIAAAGFGAPRARRAGSMLFFDVRAREG